MSEKKDNPYDFQVGDKVYCLLYGNGVVKKIAESLNYPIGVIFDDDDDCIWYNYDGYLYRTYKNRCLYHGHDLKVTADEKKPVRYPWVNVYKGVYSGRMMPSNITHTTREDAEKNTKEFGTAEYLFTCQLKPE